MHRYWIRQTAGQLLAWSISDHRCRPISMTDSCDQLPKQQRSTAADFCEVWTDPDCRHRFVVKRHCPTTPFPVCRETESLDRHRRISLVTTVDGERSELCLPTLPHLHDAVEDCWLILRCVELQTDCRQPCECTLNEILSDDHHVKGT